MFREAHASWKGGSYAGEGEVSTPSGVLNHAPYSFGKLAEIPPSTTPCELLTAAIASSMSLMVARDMARLNVKPVTVDVDTVLTLDNPADKWQITGGHLKISARAMVADKKGFEQAVEAARQLCPVSTALKLNLTCATELTALTASSAA